MGGLLHFFDFNQAGTSRKSLTQKRHIDGLEAPRNSLDLPIETSQNYDAMDEHIPYSYQVKQNYSKQFHPSEASMKKLIDAEISKEPDVRRNVPSVVARLMGMDMFPSEPKPTIHIKEKKNEVARNVVSGKEQTEKSSVRRSSLGLKHSQQDASLNSLGRDHDESSNDLKFEKPRPREHPQEEQLQKFKKDFEAWQAARVWENSRALDLGSVPRQWLAQEHLNKEKMALYTDTNRMTANVKPKETKAHNSQPVLNPYLLERTGLKDHGYKKERFKDDRKESVTLRNRTRTSDFKQVTPMNCDEKRNKSAVPTRIVILKPGFDRSAITEESWAGSSEIVEEEGSMEGFLEEVKERLRFEMQGKSAKRVSVVRQLGTETPLGEKPSNPKQIARHIAKQVRESVTRDLGMNLLRSESTRSYRSEIQIDGLGSPEFINRDTRKFLTERLRNVLKEDMHLDVPTLVNGSLRSSMLNNEKSRLSSADVLKTGNSYWENVKDPYLLSSSFRYGQQNEVLHVGDMSPRNLLRSLSAPVSGTSFGKLLLEDRHVLTGAHIRRKHEATGNVSVELRKSRKEKFSFKGKVSNFRYRFTLKSKLFGRKIESVEESWSDESDSVKDHLMSGPTLVANHGSAQENSTEVPPSPASVCSSPREEFYRMAEHPSPISTLDVPMIEDHAVPQAFREISSNLHELRKQLNQLDSGRQEDKENIEESPEAEIVELEGQAEAYIKDILLVSGLYDRSSDQSFTRWESLSRPLSKWVFEKVEESYLRSTEEDGPKKDLTESSKVDHKLLFDLLNEALSAILGRSLAMSTFKRKVVGPIVALPPRGKELLDAVWKMIHMYVYPPIDGSFYSLDSTVTHDLETIPWSYIMHDDIDKIGREMEDVILRELIEETIKEICL